MSDTERQRWERFRRAVLNMAAQLVEADPSGRYTVDVRIIERDQQARKIA